MPQNRDPVVSFEVKVNGAPLKTELQLALTHVIIDHRLRVPDLVSLGFHDPHRAVLEDSAFALGNGLEVKAKQAGDAAASSLFDGEITALEVEYDTAGMLAVVRGLDRSHRLSHGRRTQSFVSMTYADIVRKLGAAAGLAVKVDATQPVHEHVLQYNQSDLEFLTELATEVGFDLEVEGRTLTFAKPKPASGAPQPGNLQASQPLQLVLGENLQSLRATATGTEQVGRVEVRGWDVVGKKAIVGLAKQTTPVGVANGVPEKGYKAAVGSVAATGVAAPYGQQASADTASTAYAQEIASARVDLEGVVLGEPRLRAGVTVSIGEAGTAFSGRYTVTATRHVYEPGEGYRTELTVSGRSDRSLRGLVAGAVHRDGGGAHARVGGVVPAIVTNNKDPENLGRVKVKFPWLTDDHESAWARPVQLVAGSSYGALIIPEVNDEVLVAFEQGDTSRPYIVGSLYNGKDKPQKAASDLVKGGKVAQRRLETPTLNRLVFFDHKGTKEGVTLRTGDDKFFLDLDKTNTRIVLSSNGDIAIEAKTGKLEITSQQDMVLKSKANLTLEGMSKTTIKGATVEVAAQASMKLQSSGPLEAKGAVIKLN